jgi:hypothetical protein
VISTTIRLRSVGANPVRSACASPCGVEVGLLPSLRAGEESSSVFVDLGMPVSGDGPASSFGIVWEKDWILVVVEDGVCGVGVDVAESMTAGKVMLVSDVGEAVPISNCICEVVEVVVVVEVMVGVEGGSSGGGNERVGPFPLSARLQNCWESD